MFHEFLQAKMKHFELRYLWDAPTQLADAALIVRVCSGELYRIYCPPPALTKSKHRAIRVDGQLG